MSKAVVYALLALVIATWVACATPEILKSDSQQSSAEPSPSSTALPTWIERNAERP
jgi:hypothetical protein